MTQFLPPTTNRLNPRERAEGVRKTRKLTQLFGQTPGVSPVSSPDPDELDIAIASGCLPVPSNLALNLKKHKLHRAAVSMSNDVVTPVKSPLRSCGPRRTEFSFRASRASAESALSQNASTLDRDPSDVIEIGTQEGVPRALRSRVLKDWSDEIDRLKDDLNEREKALNVRRAVKMEKMFGVRPADAISHTTNCGRDDLSRGEEAEAGLAAEPSATAAFRFNHADTDSLLEPNHDLSAVYLHFRHSLNSLNDIIDRETRRPRGAARLH
ncbi:hypothetical protein A0H81_01250 [Grifola frondosa]|uniref:Uncharacterized protein n=1 Tax=Grifola frondosa TaxID=5627 RepID=A0A1C7MNZ3_GRIFR|nr:hypothetical protein A0H81_01250 [Grifola frondosa]